jgi:hypothetical protein
MPELLSPKDRTPAQQAVAAALGSLPPQTAERTAAEFLAAQKEQFLELNYGPPKGTNWWGWVLNKHRSHGSSDRFPGEDHSHTREKDGRRFFITEPYNIRFDDLIEMIGHCQKHGLECSISGDSPWFPASTVLVVVRSA